MANNAIKPEAKDYYQRRYASLVTERSSWISHWKEISTFILPRSGRFFLSDRNDGRKRNNNIYDSTATRALRVLGAGLMGGATSPARPWFRLTTSDPKLMDAAAVKLWMSEVTRLILDVFQKSNTYRVLHSMYGELGAFGTAACLVMDDFDNIIHLFPLTAGEYCLATDYKGNVTTLYREFDATVGAVVHEFGYDNCAQSTQSSFDSGNLDEWVTICHAIEPRYNRDPSKLDNKNMPFKSVYFEYGANKDQFLREGGFKRFRGLCPRWEVTGGDIYGSGPGMEALGDAKQLQHEQLRKAEGIDYQTKPPLQIPSSLKNKDVNRFPGGNTFVDPNNPSGGVKPMFEVQLNLQHLLLDIQDVRQRINQTFYTDLFLMLSSQNETQMTATEVAERHEEKLLMLGPVLERLHNELLDPLVTMTFERLHEVGLLPPIPQELQDTELSVQFVSVLAQAQRSVATNSVDRWVANIGQIAAFKPGILDKFDADKYADVYGDMLGIDPEIIIPDDIVAKKRAADAERQQQAEAMQAANLNSQTAANLGKAPTNNKNALTDVMNQFSGYTTPAGNA